MSLFDTIALNPRVPSLQLGWVNESKLYNRVRCCEESSFSIKNEQVLTHLCEYGYAIHADGAQRLAQVLLEDDALTYTGPLWFEFLPVPTRRREGETHLDLSCGHLRRRERTVSGIEFAYPAEEHSWVGVIEAKLLSDISCNVDYDPFRNQFLRVIETAITL